MGTPAGASTADRVKDVVEPVVRSAGLFLEDVSVSRAGRRSVVRVTVDLDEDAVGSLGSDALADVSRDVSAAMDTADPVRGEYVLEVSTPGTDRPLTTLRHLRRARTRLVALTLRDGSVVRGRLLDATPAGYQVQPTEGPVRDVDASELVRGVVEVELSRASSDSDHTAGDTGDGGDARDDAADDEQEEG